MKPYHLAALAAAAILPLGACVAAPDGSATCRAEDAAKLAGRAAPRDAQIMALTGASTVRRAQEGQPLTMEYLESRVTVLTDASGTRILRATCG